MKTQDARLRFWADKEVEHLGHTHGVIVSDADLNDRGDKVSQGGYLVAAQRIAEGHHRVEFGVAGRGAWCPIDWRCSKQTVPGNSTMATETIAVHAAVQNGLPALTMLYPPETKQVVPICGDNAGSGVAMKVGHNVAMEGYSRYCGLKSSLLHFAAEHDLICFEKILGTLNPTDIFTKKLGRLELRKEAMQFGMLFQDGCCNQDEVNKVILEIMENKKKRNVTEEEEGDTDGELVAADHWELDQPALLDQGKGGAADKKKEILYRARAAMRGRAKRDSAPGSNPTRGTPEERSAPSCNPTRGALAEGTAPDFRDKWTRARRTAIVRKAREALRRLE
jgi:hypothetical protein